MTLPEVCPLDESQICKGRECHLFCLEWRTKEPTCLIGYSTTSRIKLGKADRNRDTYAEDTFRKFDNRPLSKRKSTFEKGDWTPKRLTIKPFERPIQRKEEGFTQSLGFQETTSRFPDSKPESNREKKLRERYAASNVKKASMHPVFRLKNEVTEPNPVSEKNQPKIQETPGAQGKTISRDNHKAIFEAFDADKKENSYISGKEEKARKSHENREKRKKLNEVMEIDLPDTYDEEFWS